MMTDEEMDRLLESSKENRGRVLRYSRRKPGRRSPEEIIRLGIRTILILGFAAAAVIYFTAQPPAANPLGYDPLQNKAYLHELEVFGGRANVLMAEFRDWFDSLWHGKPLAFTVAVLTLFAAWGFRITVLLLQPIPEEGDAPIRSIPKEE
jgi:hypothetical protein